MISLTLPYPPSINHVYGHHKSRKYIKPAGRAYRQTVAEIVAEAGYATLEGAVGVFIVVYMPDRRRRDMLNLEKFLSDSLTEAGVWLDDSQIADFHMTRHKEIIKGGLLKIVVRGIDE